MITQAILNAFSRAIAQFIGLIPPLPESVMDSAQNAIVGVVPVFESASRLAPMVPFVQIGQAVTLYLTLWAIGVGIWVFRAIISYVTGGGGAT